VTSVHECFPNHAGYSKADRERAELALRSGKESVPKIFNELYNLLEEYAPAWYSEEQHKRAESTAHSLKNLRDPSVGLARGAAGS
jgi:hypothetical protein